MGARNLMDLLLTFTSTSHGPAYKQRSIRQILMKAPAENKGRITTKSIRVQSPNGSCTSTRGGDVKHIFDEFVTNMKNTTIYSGRKVSIRPLLSASSILTAAALHSSKSLPKLFSIKTKVKRSTRALQPWKTC